MLTGLPLPSRLRGPLARNTVAQLATHALLRGSGFVVGIAAARLWDVARFGDYQYILALSGLFAFMATLGVNLLLVREVARDRSRSAEIVGTSLSLAVALSILCVLVAVVMSRLLPQVAGRSIALVLGVLGVGVSGINSVLAAVAHAHERMEVETLMTTVDRLLFVTGALGVLALGAGMIPLLAVAVAAHLVGTAGYLRYLALLHVPVRLRWAWRSMTSLAGRSLQFGANLILSTIYIQIDFVMLGLMVGSAEVAVYAAATSFVMPAGVIATSFSRSLMPRLSRYLDPKAEGSTILEAGELSQRATRLLLALGVPMAAGLGMLADEVVRLVYGERYSSSALLLCILAPVIPLKFLSNAYATLLTSGDRQGTRTLAVLVAALLNVGLNLWLIPIGQARGAAAATLVTELVLCVVLHGMARRMIGQLPLVRLALMPLLCTAGMALVLGWTRPWGLLASGVLAAAVYLGLLALFGRKERVRLAS